MLNCDVLFRKCLSQQNTSAPADNPYFDLDYSRYQKPCPIIVYNTIKAHTKEAHTICSGPTLKDVKPFRKTLASHGLYPPFQSAYHKCRSTETALLKVQSNILMNFDSRRVTLLMLQ